jgi:hypothetical protein
MEPPFRVKSETKGLAPRFAAWAVILVAPTQIRTGVLALKGLRPGPLDDGGGFQAHGFYHPTGLGSRKTGQKCACQVK